MKKVLIIIGIIIILIFMYGKVIEPNNLKVKEYTINTKNIPESFKELKIIHFSDLLYNNNKNKLDKIKEIINEYDADILVFTGDLFHKNYKYKEKDINDLKKFLSSLESSLYKYAVIGDNDKKHIDKYKDILYESEFTLLDNKSELLFYKDEVPINIIGITNTKNFDELLVSEVEYDYKILLTHKPDNIDKLKEYDIDLVLSGHSLGGLINVPFYGGLVKKDGATNYVNDYYKVGNTNLYVNNGLGYESFEFRLFNTPSINVYRFK